MAVFKTARNTRIRAKSKFQLIVHFITLKFFPLVLESSQKEFYKARNNEDEFNKNLTLNEFRVVESY